MRNNFFEIVLPVIKPLVFLLKYLTTETDEDNALFLPPVKSKESLDETSESLKSLDLNSELLAQLSNSFETHKNVAQQSFQKIQKVIDNLDS